jgi:tetratricopeptide (TPR) repeat protein
MVETHMAEVAQVCSQCGWSFDSEALQKNTCKKCKSAILVTSVAYLEKFDKPAIQKYIAQYTQALKADPQDRDALLALSICYLKLSLFDLADRFLRALIDAHAADPAGYYYRAISILKGKRPRTASLPVIREAEQLIGTALELDPANGRYEVLLAAIRHDYYILNGMRVPAPSPEDLVASAVGKYVDQREVEQIFGLINVGEGPVRQRFTS